MAAWLLKTEPSTYAFSDLRKEKQTRWDGITNPVALRHLRQAQVGETAVIYHTGDEKCCVGLAEIVKPAYADPKNDRLVVIDLAVRAPLARPVTLAALKADPRFAESPLVRQGRLSFVPLTDPQLARILTLGGG
jgi:predicted RNA-binding protein with PUA-like domain